MATGVAWRAQRLLAAGLVDSGQLPREHGQLSELAQIVPVVGGKAASLQGGGLHHEEPLLC